MTKATSATITLHAGPNTLQFRANVKKDGSVVTTVSQRDAEKKLSRGMTEKHPDMAAAKAHIATLAKKAETLGWQRRAGFAGKPDAFSKIPAAPKVA
jgi:hypothetical protein